MSEAEAVNILVLTIANGVVIGFLWGLLALFFGDE